MNCRTPAYRLHRKYADIHNGIIDNYLELKEQLIREDGSFALGSKE